MATPLLVAKAIQMHAEQDQGRKQRLRSRVVEAKPDARWPSSSTGCATCSYAFWSMKQSWSTVSTSSMRRLA
jgi:hypothetical protein